MADGWKRKRIRLLHHEEIDGIQVRLVQIHGNSVVVEWKPIRVDKSRQDEDNARDNMIGRSPG